MRKLTTAIVVLAILLVRSAPVLAWGNDGHRTVGAVAALFLKKENHNATLQWIAQILKNETLAEVATWADKVKGKKFNPNHPSPDPDTNEFLKSAENKNKNNRSWHFVDLPLDCQTYERCDESPIKFTKSTDIVQIINICIATLQDNPSSEHPLSKRNALRLLVHFIGDLHQPLHVGVGFLKVDEDNDIFEIIRDPVVIKKKNYNPDVGANLLLLNGSDTSNLHNYWDEVLVEEAIDADNQTPDGYPQFLVNNVTPQPSWKPQGNDLSTWAKQWANDSLALSGQSAYSTVVVTGTRLADPFNLGANETQAFDITLGPTYRKQNLPVIRQQLTKAGYRLAKLLAAIHP